jgi:transglutaminase-like putative cysteine protease
MNRFHLLHATEFVYDGPVYESYNEVRLRPIHDDLQSCLSFRLSTTPASRVGSYKDGVGNWVHLFNVLPEHRRLRIEAESVVLAHEAPTADPGGPTLAELREMRHDLREEHFDYVSPSAYIPSLPQLSEIAKAAEERCDGTVSGFVQAASDYIHENFTYMKGATHVHSSVADSLSLRAGVCQDFAQVLLGVVRTVGMPARYVSGYLVPGEAANLDSKQEEVIGGQASHAWAEVLLPGSGWIGFDPTLGKAVGLRHVRIAYGRDYGDVPPVRGIYKGRAGQRLSVDVLVRPALDEEGCETLAEACAAHDDPVNEAERPQQPQQQ